MIARNSMTCGPTLQPARRRFRRILGSLLLTTAAVILINPFTGGWRQFVLVFSYGFTYSVCIGSLAWLILPRFGMHFGGLSPIPKWTIAIAIMVAVAIIGSLIAGITLASLGFFPWSRYWLRFWEDLRYAVVITIITGVVMSLYESMRYRLQYEVAQARLSSLESRLHPHFLFNTLNSISALIPENPAAAETMTEQLAALLRFSLDSTERTTVPLQQELKIATDYLEIERARFGPRLNYSIDVPAELMNAEVPPFSVQTLVENSVKYGGGQIRISARNGNGLLILNVWDSGPGLPDETVILPGHGLRNLRSRLAVLWGSRAKLEFHREDSGTSVQISLPNSAMK
jgi:two-component system, LytTR family, sensor histidine kinase AlgZ